MRPEVFETNRYQTAVKRSESLLTTHPRFTHAVRHALPTIAGWVNRWTGDVFGVYPLYDVYDNLRGACALGQKLNLFLAHGRCVPPPCLSATDRKDGGAGRDRTDDLKLAKLPLSQLSYVPEPACRPKPAATSPPSPTGLRRTPIPRFAGEGWWAWEDSNFRPHAYQARALTN